MQSYWWGCKKCRQRCGGDEASLNNDLHVFGGAAQHVPMLIGGQQRNNDEAQQVVGKQQVAVAAARRRADASSDGRIRHSLFA